MLVYRKKAAERWDVAVEFAGKLPTGATLASGVCTATQRDTGADVTGTILNSGSATISGTKAIFHGKAGTSPTDYTITVTVTLTDPSASVLVEHVLLQVRDHLALIATPGAATANSYATLSEADIYHQVHLYNSAWLTADDWQREAALIWATRLLDEQVDWMGNLTTNEQALRWPRSGVLDRDGCKYLDQSTIPLFLKTATAELARHLLGSDRTQERSFGIQSVVADTVEVTFDKHDVKPVLPPSVVAIVAPYGTVGGAGSGMAKLQRV